MCITSPYTFLPVRDPFPVWSQTDFCRYPTRHHEHRRGTGGGGHTSRTPSYFAGPYFWTTLRHGPVAAKLRTSTNSSSWKTPAKAIGASFGGRKGGGLSRAAAFSFFPHQEPGLLRRRWLIATDDDQLAVPGLPPVVAHGITGSYCTGWWSEYSRLDEVQAAVLRVKLRHLEGWNQEAAGAGGPLQPGLCRLP